MEQQPNLAASREVEELAKDYVHKFWFEQEERTKSIIRLAFKCGYNTISKAKEEEIRELREALGNLIEEYRHTVKLLDRQVNIKSPIDELPTLSRSVATLNKYKKEQKDERSVARNDAQS